jgi:lysozyme
MGRAPIIYTGFFFWRDSAGNGSNLGCPLWLAAYNNSPMVPVAWSAFSLWQYTSTGSVSGISGNVDRDACALSKTALNNLRLP